MTLKISGQHYAELTRHLESAYPQEGAGLLLGTAVDGGKQVKAIRPLANEREEAARHNRYLITPEQILRGENEAARLGLDVIGIFHSHPDHPARPSEFDREWALPWYSYVITAVQAGRATVSHSWRLKEDRTGFLEEKISIGSQEVGKIGS